ncbi:hypothetical protein TWF506_010284 [Arthrobotrys conoides]|uniref:Uncharacterized protein n=1 Tax=Arthrobotrys conoides TaxID=74498 RepID=A0AAN8NAU4_9PEZI
MIFSGLNRQTDDLDFVGTQEALFAFYNAASRDKRFRSDESVVWFFDVAVDGESFTVPMEFLLEGMDVDRVMSPEPFEGGFKASLLDLAIQKARAYQGRGSHKDINDFEAIILTMAARAENFARLALEYSVREALQEAAIDAGARTRTALNEML